MSEMIEQLKKAEQAYKQKDYDTAAKLFLDAANKGEVIGQNNIAYLYEHGKGVKKDLKKALYWYIEAAKSGSPKANHNVGRFYKDGLGTQKDLNKAAKYFAVGASGGLAKSQYELAVIYISSADKSTRSKGFENLYLAANQNYPEAQVLVGRYFYSNDDYAQALQWFEKSAKNGNGDACFYMGVFYSEGYGVSVNKAQALNWYLKAEKYGNTDCLYNIGQIYIKGYGVEQNYKKAFEYYKKAAKHGVEAAIYNLACCYGNGDGVAENPVIAYDYCKRAADLGFEMAKDKLKLFEENRRYAWQSNGLCQHCGGFFKGLFVNTQRCEKCGRKKDY